MFMMEAHVAAKAKDALVQVNAELRVCLSL